MNKLLLFGLPLVLLLLLIPVTTNLALASSNEESEEEQEQEGENQGDGGEEVRQQGQGEECTAGPSMIKGLMGNGNSTDPSTDPIWMDQYNDAVRTEEIKTYIAEKVDKFDIPDWLYGTSGDTTGTFCLIAGEVVDQEKTQGTRFEGSDLDDNIAMQTLKKQGEIVSNVLENP
jgi:hypothetical protein